MPAAAARPLMTMTLMPVTMTAVAGDPLVVPLQLGNHGRRENQHERRARDAEAQQVDRLQHGLRQRRHGAAHVDGRDDGDEGEIDRRRPARARQRALNEVRLELRLRLRGEAQPFDLALGLGIDRAGFGEPGFARPRGLHDEGPPRQFATRVTVAQGRRANCGPVLNSRRMTRPAWNARFRAPEPRASGSPARRQFTRRRESTQNERNVVE